MGTVGPGFTSIADEKFYVISDRMPHHKSGIVIDEDWENNSINTNKVSKAKRQPAGTNN